MCCEESLLCGLYLFYILEQSLIIDLAAGNPDRTGRFAAVHHFASFAALRQHLYSACRSAVLV